MYIIRGNVRNISALFNIQWTIGRRFKALFRSHSISSVRRMKISRKIEKMIIFQVISRCVANFYAYKDEYVSSEIYKTAKVKYPLEYLINETKLPFRFHFFNFISMNFLDEFVSIFSVK